MAFQSGKPKTGGRQPGVPNKFTASFREAVRHVYNGLGGHKAFLEWARANPTEYYRIAARLTPPEKLDAEKDTVRVFIQAPDGRSVEVLPQAQPALVNRTMDEREDPA